KEFEDFCEEAWKDSYSYVVLDLSRNPDSGQKYRKCFDGFYTPDKYTMKKSSVRELIRENQSNISSADQLKEKILKETSDEIDIQSKLAAMYQPIIQETKNTGKNIQKAIKDTSKSTEDTYKDMAVL